MSLRSIGSQFSRGRGLVEGIVKSKATVKAAGTKIATRLLNFKRVENIDEGMEDLMVS